MFDLPTPYAWLTALDPLPTLVQAALQYYGTEEQQGHESNPVIMSWAEALGISDYVGDDIPWCGLFMARVAVDAHYAPPASPLWALNWARFAEEGGQPELGDVVVFTRTGAGHVGIYVAEDAACYHVLGGNQGDRVSITRIAKDRLYAVRQPPYASKPATATPFRVVAGGSRSDDER